MKVNKIDLNYDYYVDTERPEGIHIKEIIDMMARDYGYNKHGDEKPDWLKETAELGIVWEHHMIKKLDLHKPKPVQESGIWCSPDAIQATDDLMSDSPVIVHEFKVKWMSSNKLDDLDAKEWWDVMAQIKSYCKVMKCNTAILHVLFVNGDYKWSNTVTGYPYRVSLQLDFTDQELEDNWNAIWNYIDSKRNEEHMDEMWSSLTNEVGSIE